MKMITFNNFKYIGVYVDTIDLLVVHTYARSIQVCYPFYDISSFFYFY